MIELGAVEVDAVTVLMRMSAFRRCPDVDVAAQR